MTKRGNGYTNEFYGDVSIGGDLMFPNGLGELQLKGDLLGIDKNGLVSPVRKTLYKRIEFTQDNVDNSDFIDIEHGLGTRFMFVIAYTERNHNDDELLAHPLTTDFLYKITDTTLSVNFGEAGTYDILAFAA